PAGLPQVASAQIHASVVPEIAASVAGFAQSARRENGLYALVDVGATTLDLSTFNLHPDREGDDHLSVLLADVQRFGIEPYRACAADPRWDQPFRRQAGITIRHVIWETRLRRDPNSGRWGEGNVLPVFVTGGGAGSDLHGAVFGSLDAWLRQHSAKRGGVELRPLDAIEGLDIDHRACDLGRLIVASGLSLPAEEVPAVTLPGAISDADLPALRDNEDAFVGKEQV
ncbi:MAG: hypothetical protein IT556_05075, partial [Acetobacteraceae bacterium]|nr:hypothetical protein [Acetobacteraceae bacterium]